MLVFSIKLGLHKPIIFLSIIIIYSDADNNALLYCLFAGELVNFACWQLFWHAFFEFDYCLAQI